MLWLPSWAVAHAALTLSQAGAIQTLGYWISVGSRHFANAGPGKPWNDSGCALSHHVNAIGYGQPRSGSVCAYNLRTRAYAWLITVPPARASLCARAPTRGKSLYPQRVLHCA